MPSTHFHGTNTEITIFKGFCEIINKHYHPIFLMLGIDENRKKFWIITQMLEDENTHSHTCAIAEEDMKEFIAEGEMSLETQSDKTGHSHKIYFNDDERQGFIIDPLDVLRGLQDNIESDDDDN
jgi:hypothetical protein